ncbi:unnamed protein product, partial [Adineta steineri]
LDWIDEKTRAVFIQLTLYNPSVELFTAVTLLAEFLPTGGIYTIARFEPINFYSIIGCSLGSTGVYFWRFQEANRISELFEETNGYIYINLQLAVYVNDILTFLLGYCCFFSMIKFVQLFRFNQQISLFSETLKSCAKELMLF